MSIQIKNSDIFHISALNIEFGYLLEPPRRGNFNEYQQSIFLWRTGEHYPGIITKTCLFKYTEIFTTKNEKFQMKNSDIFHISAQNIYCG